MPPRLKLGLSAVALLAFSCWCSLWGHESLRLYAASSCKVGLLMAATYLAYPQLSRFTRGQLAVMGIIAAALLVFSPQVVALLPRAALVLVPVYLAIQFAKRWLRSPVGHSTTTFRARDRRCDD